MSPKEQMMDYAKNSPYQGERLMSIKKFLSMSEEERKKLGDVEIVPPSLGSSSMGGIRVRSNDAYPHK
ncbi:MAG: hypothetical protein M3Y08_09230 [Fibrobacterota bacterium]|nr:hypothetical protein [Fibrobacterota bacterium]